MMAQASGAGTRAPSPQLSVHVCRRRQVSSVLPTRKRSHDRSTSPTLDRRPSPCDPPYRFGVTHVAP